MTPCVWLTWALLASACAEVIFMPQNNFQPVSGQAQSLPIELDAIFDNKAFGLEPNETNFDGSGGKLLSLELFYSKSLQWLDSYPAQSMPPSAFTYTGLNYRFPKYNASSYDNAIATGQTISIPRGRYLSVHMLAASENGMAQGTVNATFADNSTSSGAVLVPAWWSWPYPTGGDMVFPYRLTEESVDWNRSNIFQTRNWLDSSKELVSITLPNVTGGAATDPGGAPISSRLHIFALTLVPAIESYEPVLSVQYARSTQKWVEGSDKVQIYEATVNNAGTQHIVAENSVELRIDSDGVETVTPGYIKRLRAGDQVRVNIAVKTKEGVEAGSYGPATVVVDGSGITSSDYTFNAVFGIKQYEPTYESIYTHDSPDWFHDLKYGIFIHWGPYAVPAWGNVGDRESYAEW